MQVYWVMFEPVASPSWTNLGAGVTSRSEDDARAMIAAAFTDVTVKALTPVHTVADLDQGHVVPNMGNIFARGIWFPIGREAVARDLP